MKKKQHKEKRKRKPQGRKQRRIKKQYCCTECKAFRFHRKHPPVYGDGKDWNGVRFPFCSVTCLQSYEVRRELEKPEFPEFDYSGMRSGRFSSTAKNFQMLSRAAQDASKVMKQMIAEMRLYVERPTDDT